MSLGVLFLGFGLGFLFVAPPGTVAFTVVEVGLLQGRSAGARSGVGVAVGDLVVAAAAATIVIGGHALSPSVFTGVQVVSAVVLLTLGVTLTFRPGVIEAVAGGIHRPGRALFVMTVATPTVLGAWIALLTALPLSTGPLELAMFVAGATGASAAWHVGLGSLAGRVGHRLTGAPVRRLTRLGGLVFTTLGVVTIATI